MTKKIILPVFLFVYFFSVQLSGQSFGLSAHLLEFHPVHDRTTYFGYGNVRDIGVAQSMTTGIRIEGNYILPGFSIPVSGFNGIGFSYFFPYLDSNSYHVILKNGNDVPVVGVQKNTVTQISFRFGYEIPQTFNDFLLLHFGWGMGYMHSKAVNVLPENSSTFNYNISDVDPSTFDPVKKGTFAGEILVGGIYEFEKFSLSAQYSVIITLEDIASSHIRHGATIGIYYPLKRL